jgi:hypothetical protein
VRWQIIDYTAGRFEAIEKLSTQIMRVRDVRFFFQPKSCATGAHVDDRACDKIAHGRPIDAGIGEELFASDRQDAV